ncbi:MAG: hypothetical protein KGJ78_05615 [Alphaproteobacteria bacterium]|nr:hypothetical protein [Alphaproteobacteria bacterium]
MSTPAPVASQVRAVRRPVGVWGMTVIDGLFAGVFLVAAAFKAGLHDELGYPLGQAILWGVAGLGIAITAQLAWYGSRLGRNLLLVLMTLYLGFGLFQNLQYLLWALREQLDNTDFISGQIWSAVRSLAWLAANFWFLSGRRTRGFFS